MRMFREETRGVGLMMIRALDKNTSRDGIHP
jgi:hypothetical protein